MMAVGTIRAALDQRDLLQIADQIADEHAVSFADICSDLRIAEVVAARHALWAALHVELGSLSAIARIFGCDHTTVRSGIAAAEERATPAIVQVLLASFENRDRRAAYQLWWRVRPAGGNFGVTDRVAGRTTWFPSYSMAHAAYAAVCEQAGAVTFRTASMVQS